MADIRIVMAVVLAIAANGASAQLTLFGQENFRGPRFDVEGAIGNLEGTGFNDRASSAQVRRGTWQLCEDAFYRGRCVTVSEGDFPSLRAMGLENRVSSARMLAGGPSPGPPSGGARVTLFEGSNFTGRRFNVDGPLDNLDGTGFNDRARSAIVNEGSWELCQDANFSGNCAVFAPGRYPDLGRLTGQLSSLRPERGRGPGSRRAARAILYEGPDFTGRQLVIDRNRIQNLAETGFNDRASSLRVEQGYWMFCSDAFFDGECRTFGPGDYPRLPPELANRISSGRRIANEYPYNQPPNWGPPR